MHNYLNIYYFIDQFNRNEIINLDKNIALIYRNYSKDCDLDTIKDIHRLCKKVKRKFFISNNLKIAKQLGLNGVYIPSFNKLRNFKNLNANKNFIVLGSAHNKIELLNKFNQGCSFIFLAPTFLVKKKQNFLGVIKFNLLTLGFTKNFIALGGINQNNLKKINLLNCSGFGGISWIKKTAQENLGRFK
jgi:thiamine-phosphate pyrophosphorylase